MTLKIKSVFNRKRRKRTAKAREEQEASVKTMRLTLANRRKLRVLCLHGHGSNDDISSIQIMGLKFRRGYECECEFLNAPHICEKPYPGLEYYSNNDFYTWGGKKFSKNGDADWEESLQYLADYCKKHGPYDGVYGFSQGAALITAFSSPKIWRTKYGLKCQPWSFAILANGGGSWLLPTRNQDLINIRSFHIKGKKDHAFKDSGRLEDRWRSDKRSSYTTKGGHAIDLWIMKREPDLEYHLHCFFDQIHYNDIWW